MTQNLQYLTWCLSQILLPCSPAPSAGCRCEWGQPAQGRLRGVLPFWILDFKHCWQKAAGSQPVLSVVLDVFAHCCRWLCKLLSTAMLAAHPSGGGWYFSSILSSRSHHTPYQSWFACVIDNFSSHCNCALIFKKMDGNGNNFFFFFNGMVLILSFLRNQIHDSLPSIFNKLFLSSCCLLHLLQNPVWGFMLLTATLTLMLLSWSCLKWTISTKSSQGAENQPPVTHFLLHSPKCLWLFAVKLYISDQFFGFSC